MTTNKSALTALVVCGGLILGQDGSPAGSAASGPRLAAPARGLPLLSGTGRIATPSRSTRPLSSRRGCATGWHFVPGPSIGTATLAAVAAVSAHDAWAVGASGVGTGAQPLIERWDGARWRVMATPPPSSTPPSTFEPYEPGSALNAVAAASVRDAWAVGSITTRAAGSQPLIERWDGRRWRLVASPRPGANSILNGVAAVSAHDAWAVGTVQGQRTLAEHWDGRAWRIVATPQLRGKDVGLVGVSALSAGNVWAVGSQGSAAEGSRRGLVERWDGRRWRVIPSPQPGVVDDALNGISADGATDIWAVGSAEGNDYQNGALVEHWTGAAWQTVPSPHLPAAGGTNGLMAVAAVAPADVWAVAGSVLVHWSGRRWSVTTLPFTPFRGGTSYAWATTGNLRAITAVSRAGLWAVGHVVEDTDQQYVTLIAGYGVAACHS